MELAREKTGGLEGVHLMLAVGEKVGGATVRAANRDDRNRELLFQWRSLTQNPFPGRWRVWAVLVFRIQTVETIPLFFDVAGRVPYEHFLTY
jgi:hypothetical protein